MVDAIVVTVGEMDLSLVRDRDTELFSGAVRVLGMSVIDRVIGELNALESTWVLWIFPVKVVVGNSLVGDVVSDNTIMVTSTAIKVSTKANMIV